MSGQLQFKDEEDENPIIESDFLGKDRDDIPMEKADLSTDT